MKNTFSRKFMVCALAGVLGFAFSACDDSSSAGGDETETSALSCSAEMSSSSRHCEDCKDEAISSSDSKSNDPAEVTDDSSDSKGNPSSAGTSTKSSNSNSSGTTTKSSSSSAGKVNGLATPCKTETEDNCEYGELVDERDGQIYKTVKIGDQWWMAENLNYLADGESFCVIENEQETDDCGDYGRRYKWGVAVGLPDKCKLGCNFIEFNYQPQGICPDGWHLPSEEDWRELIFFIGGKYEETTGGTFAFARSNDINSFGFEILLTTDEWGYSGAHFWSASLMDERSIYDIEYFLDRTGNSIRVRRVLTSYLGKWFETVRCVKGREPALPFTCSKDLELAELVDKLGRRYVCMDGVFVRKTSYAL